MVIKGRDIINDNVKVYQHNGSKEIYRRIYLGRTVAIAIGTMVLLYFLISFVNFERINTDGENTLDLNINLILYIALSLITVAVCIKIYSNKYRKVKSKLIYVYNDRLVCQTDGFDSRSSNREENEFYVAYKENIHITNIKNLSYNGIYMEIYGDIYDEIIDSDRNPGKTIIISFQKTKSIKIYNYFNNMEELVELTKQLVGVINNSSADHGQNAVIMNDSSNTKINILMIISIFMLILAPVMHYFDNRTVGLYIFFSCFILIVSPVFVNGAGRTNVQVKMTITFLLTFIAIMIFALN